MLKIKLIRETPDSKEQSYTHGYLLIQDSQGKRHLDFGYTLEDPVRDFNKDGDLKDEGEKKVYGRTAIPFGKYEGQITYSPAFGRDLPLIKNVPHFSGIRIHAGNTAKHTEGCILVGYATNNKGAIWKSRDAVEDLMSLIRNNDKESRFEIEIV